MGHLPFNRDGRAGWGIPKRRAYRDAVDVEEFRRAADQWLAEHAAAAPPNYGPIMPPGLREQGMAWQASLAAAGFAGIDWPTECGGRGLTAGHNAAWLEACARADVPPVLNMVGLVLAAKAILAFGSDDQRLEHLGRTARGEVVWCQLFSEPGAGSDLASLATRAERDGDEWIVNGQKVWTSGARCSDWGILLARTDPDVPKHKGISFFLLDMHSPGVDVRPLRQMTGEAEFDEVFMTDVRVPAGNLVGPLHGGWGVTMATLTNERGFIGAATVGLARRLDAMAATVAGAGAGAGAAVRRDQFVDLYATGRALLALGGRQGPQASAASSLLKLGMTELSFASAMARAGAAGPAAMLEGDAAYGVTAAPGARLGGGTSEIQRNIIGEFVLGLPKEPKPPTA